MRNGKVILGVGGLVHDASLTYLINGIPKAIIEEERLTRKKHIGGVWDESLKVLKKKYRLYPENIDYIAVARQDVPAVWKKKIGFKHKNFFEKFAKDKIFRVDHHLAHAASSFYPSAFQEAAILTVDAIGDNVSTWMGYGKGKKLHEFHRINYLHSLGFLWIRTCKILGYPDIFSAGKIMAMASYGKPIYYDLLKSIIKFKKDGTYEINPGKFNSKEVSRYWNDEKPFFLLKALNIKSRKLGFPIKQIYFDIAASLQKITEDVIIHMCKHLHKKTKSENICVAGGVFLNGYVNQRIIEKTPFKRIFIQPAASDVGDGLGASLYLYHNVLRKPRKWTMSDTYLGMDFSKQEVLMALETNKEFVSYKSHKNISQKTATLLSQGKVVGWFQGKSEFGPRALGNRSILADARDSKMRIKLNEIKDREWFRPVAPSVTEKKAKVFFDIHLPSKYMLLIGKVRQAKKYLIPAVTHIDDSARVQTVNKRDNSKYFKLLKEFEKITNIPVICNTSFNRKKEPIVNSPQDAINTFLKSPKIDYLVIENFLVKRKPALNTRAGLSKN